MSVIRDTFQILGGYGAFCIVEDLIVIAQRLRDRKARKSGDQSGGDSAS